MARTYTKRVKTSVMDVNVSGLKINLKGLVELEKKLKSLPDIQVGYLDSKQHPKWPLTFAEIAAINYFGVRSYKAGREWFIPPRKMMDVAFENSSTRIDSSLAKALTSAITIKGQANTNRAFRELGKTLADRLNLAVSAGDYVDNALATQKMKGKNDPLNWTGAFAKAARFRLVRKTK